MTLEPRLAERQSSTDAPGHHRGTPRPAFQRAAKSSYWLLVPFIWFFIISTRSLSSWLGRTSIDSTSDPDLSGSPMDRVLLTGLLVLGLWILKKRSARTSIILNRNKWVLALFLYMSLSICWSNFPEISARRAVRSAGTLVMVLLILTETDVLGAIRTLLRRLYLLHIPLSILAIKYIRTIGVVYSWDGVEEMWVGLAVHKNNLGQVAMCSGIVSAWQVLARWPAKILTPDLFLLLATLWLLRGSPNSHSSTAIGGFAVGCALLLGLQTVRRRNRELKKFALIGALLLLGLVPVVLVVSELAGTTAVNAALQASGRDMTLTGRTGLWQDILTNASKSPALGVGFGAFWVGHIGYDLYPLENWSRVTPGWRPNQGHNGYLDVYIDLGAIGLALTLAVLVSGFKGAIGDLRDNFELGRIRLTFLVSISMNNFTESSLLKGTHSLWFLLLLVAVNVPYPLQGARRLHSAGGWR